MFCSKCGAELADNAKFCSNCGNVVKKVMSQTHSGTTSMISANEVFIRGFKCAGNGMYYAFSYFTPVILVVLGFYIAQYTNFGLFLALIGLLAGFLIKKIFKQSILYDESNQTFFYNAHSHLPFTMKSLNIADVKSIRLRYVKIGFGTSKVSLNDPGKYHVISLDATDPEKSIKVWFPKDGNAEEFIPVLEKAIQTSGKSLTVDKKDELIKWADFETELNNA
ncbi:zinc ribbon domain-containing protein [Treponema sp.]|uniref:zinc ribbon domain-containing protein n=1 Tax=Treponema sp. TaxID=166 RepID=UPI0025FFBEA2|nr:zinc ribbon domain-containing protein [Treponema sp.]MBR4322075.1 zinc ribbon domain-containing protein [Treponema sp.]